MSATPLSSPYVSAGQPVGRLMLQVVVALLPGTLAYAWFFGPGVLINITLAVVLALIFEAAILKLRQRPVLPHLSDCSAVVAAWLFALCLPTAISHQGLCIGRHNAKIQAVTTAL